MDHFSTLTTDELETCERYGSGLGANMLSMARMVGDSCGSHLYMLANMFGEGLSDKLLQDKSDEIRRIFRQSLEHSPLGIGDEMLKDPEVMGYIYTAAEAAMLGRYEALAEATA